MPLFRLPCVVVLGSLCLASVAAAQDTPPSYSKDIAPFFKKYCVECHGGKTVKSGFNFSSYEDLLRGSKKGKKGIDPGNPDSSQVVRTLEGKAKKMPPKNRTQPDKSEVTLLRAWITAGAKDDPPKSDAPKSDAPKTGLILFPFMPQQTISFSISRALEVEEHASLTRFEIALSWGFYANGVA